MYQSRSKLFIGGIIFSILIMGAAFAPIFLFSSESSSWLQNSGNWGQFISGVFAPVAFIWVVIAVILQSKELELQRQELEETRSVLNLQKEEMKRAADENREQTRIMTENLQKEAARIEYEQLDTMLYSTALFIFTNRNNFAVELIPQNAFNRIFDLPTSSINKQSSDEVFALIYQSLLSQARSLMQAKGQALRFVSPEGRTAFLETRKRFVALKGLKKTPNQLVVTRLEGLNWDSLADSFVYLCDRVEAHISSS